MKKLIYLVVVVIAAFSCNKDDDSNTPSPITMESLAGDYKITSATVNGTDVLSLYLPLCQQDNVYTLKADSTYTVTDAGTVCNPSSDTTGMWSLSGNQVTIGPQQFTIVNFDGSRLEVTTAVTQNGIPLTVDVVFTKQ